MTGHEVTREQVQEIAAGLRRLLDAVASGELTAGSGTVARLEGAAVAFECLTGTDLGGPPGPTPT